MNFCSNPFICCYNRCCPCCPIIPGIPGRSATVTVGSTITAAPGTPASVTNSGTNTDAVLNFVIPSGENGTSATVSVGTTTTLPAGSDATVTNVGTSTNAILNFGIPEGESLEINSGNYISRSTSTYTTSNSTINLPIVLNSDGITIQSNSSIIIPSTGRYKIEYGVVDATGNKTIGLYINGTNNTNTNLITSSNNNTNGSVILSLQEDDVLTLGAIDATTEAPLSLQEGTINAYISIISLD